jgi:hypothetical protein
MSPAAFPNLGEQGKVRFCPLPWVPIVDGHQWRKPSALDQRHADRRSQSDLEERRRLRRLQLGADVVQHERLAGSQIRDGEPAEIGKLAVIDDAWRARRAPVAADGEAVLIGVHIGVSANRNSEMLASVRVVVAIMSSACVLAAVALPTASRKSNCASFSRPSPVPRIHEFDGVFATTKEEGGGRHLFNQLLFLRFAKGWNTRRPDWFSLDCSSDRAIPKGLLQSAPHGD